MYDLRHAWSTSVAQSRSAGEGNGVEPEDLATDTGSPAPSSSAPADGSETGDTGFRIRALAIEPCHSRQAERQRSGNGGRLDLPSDPRWSARWTPPLPWDLAEPGPSPRLLSGDVIRFADCELNLDRIVLRRGGEEIRIEPQVFDVLAYLVEHRGAVVRKEELLDAIWGDRFVSESALTTRIKAARQAVGDDGSQQSIIRTVHGKGYEFVAIVEEVEEGQTGAAMCPAATGTSIGVRVQPLIGRETLLDQLAEMIGDHRLVTLVGPGGVGKTSLGMELARIVAGEFEDGVHVVELVGVVDQDATAAALATAIDVNLRKSSSIDDAIVDLLRPRHSLLVLDNCEHLIEPVAELVARILREAPTISIVATSREPLAVAGERLWTVDPLPTGPKELFGSDLVLGELAEIPAVALFVARAKAADPSFVLDAVTAPLVVEICRRLDGIPLAIELAAARARAIGVAEVAHRLDQRFGVLKAMRRGSDPRHRTMHDAISWSYDMLEPDERALFTALSVFAGSFDLRSAEAMAPGGDALDLLTRLTERSMLAVRPRAGGSTRYELLETLREYGRTRLSDARAAELFAAHAETFRRRRPEPSRRSYVVPARATRSPGPSPRSRTCEPRSALPLSLGHSMSPSASSARSASSPCGRCAMKSSRGRTPPATRRARSTIHWPPRSPGSVRTARGCGGSSTSPFSSRRRRAASSTSCRSFPAVSRNEPLPTCCTSWATR